MEELLNIFSLFMKLNYFTFQQRIDPDAADTYIFTLLPSQDSVFDNKFILILARLFPQEIFMEISSNNNSIEFRASCKDQDRLVDAFGDILKEVLNDEALFTALLITQLSVNPFQRLLQKYTKPQTPLMLVVTDFPTVSEPISAESENEKQKENEIAPPAIIPTTELPPIVSYFFTAACDLIEQLIEPPETELNQQLKSDLTNIVRLMDLSTQPSSPKHMLDFWGGLKNAGQKVKNTVINPLMGDAVAAINIKEKIRHYSLIQDHHYTAEELTDIMQLITSRSLHVAQAHLIDKHQEELNFLNAAEKQTRKIQKYIEQEKIILAEKSDELLSPALPGCHS